MLLHVVENGPQFTCDAIVNVIARQVLYLRYFVEYFVFLFEETIFVQSYNIYQDVSDALSLALLNFLIFFYSKAII